MGNYEGFYNTQADNNPDPGRGRYCGKCGQQFKSGSPALQISRIDWAHPDCVEVFISDALLNFRTPEER